MLMDQCQSAPQVFSDRSSVSFQALLTEGAGELLIEGEFQSLTALLPDMIQNDLATAEQACRTYLRDQLAAPRSIDLALEFLLQKAPFKRYSVFPAGELTRNYLARKPEGVSGCVDNQPAVAIDEFTAVTPAEYIEKYRGERGDEGLLVLHQNREAFLVQQLKGLGLAENRIATVFSNDAFSDWWQLSKQRFFAAIDTELFNEGGTLIEQVVVTSNHQYSLLGLEQLLETFSPKNTLVVNVGRGALPESDYPVVDVQGSFDLLHHCLTLVDPKLIYVATVQVDNYWAMLIKESFQTKTVVHEIYDLSSNYRDERIGAFYSVDTQLLAASRIGESYSLREMDLVISKRGGGSWRKLIPEHARYQCYFQGMLPLEQVDSCKNTEATGLSLVYAGPMSLTPRHDWFAWDFVTSNALFSLLAESEGIQFSVYNSFDGSSSNHNEQFYPERQLIEQQGGKYHSRTPLSELAAQLGTYDYGWMCLHKRDYQRETPDVELVYSARLNTYISAGLPVIIDATWKEAAILVNQFDAGIVVDLDELSEQGEQGEQCMLAYIASKADPDRHRSGAAELAAYMRAANTRVLDLLAEQLNEEKSNEYES